MAGKAVTNPHIALPWQPGEDMEIMGICKRCGMRLPIEWSLFQHATCNTSRVITVFVKTNDDAGHMWVGLRVKEDSQEAETFTGCVES